MNGTISCHAYRVQVNFIPSFLSPVPRPHVFRGAARERDRLVDVRCKNIVLQRPKQRSQRYDSPVLG